MNYSARGSEPLQVLAANLHNLLPIGLAVAAWAAATWSKLKKKQAGEKPPAADEAERTRRVQEEVRRKIAERRGRQPESPPVREVPGRPARGETWRERARREIAPVDPFGGPGRRLAKPAPAASPAPRPFSPPEPDDSGARERQQWLTEQALVREATAARTAAGLAQTALTTPSPVVSPWLTELREPSAVRRAIVLREILGPPVGLR
jgi:hypothetical protein